MATYIGLDQSLSNTGYAVLDNNTIYYGTIPTSSRLLREKRVQIILDKLSELLKRFEPKIVFTEYVYRSAPLLKLEACIHQDLYRANKNFVIVKPKNWTEILGATGTKKEFQIVLSQFTENKFRNADESDAIGVLLGGLVYNGIESIDFSKLIFIPENPPECRSKKEKKQPQTKKGKQSRTAA